MGKDDAFVITIDIDWAPDFAIEAVASALRVKGVRATWFVTHQSDAVEGLRAEPELFELGIHPNFLPNSSHGCTPIEILKHVLAIVPNAISTRSHSGMQSGRILETVVNRTQIKLDSTLFLPGMSGIQPFRWWSGGKSLLRLPFFWADDHEMERPYQKWNLSQTKEIQGLKVFDFHPIHLYLNSADTRAYEALKQRGARLNELTEKEAEPYVNPDEGARTMFDQLVDHLSIAGDSLCLRDFCAESNEGPRPGD